MSQPNDALFGFVKRQLKQGKKIGQVKKLLRKKGLNSEEAMALIHEV